jgi:hypothetical protein
LQRLFNWLNAHKFEVHVLSFMLMILPSAGLFFAAQAGSNGLILGFLALVITGNLLVVAAR